MKIKEINESGIIFDNGNELNTKYNIGDKDNQNDHRTI